MECWPANVVGVFFLVLLISDVYYGRHLDLPAHAIVGIVGTLSFWLVCSVLGETISATILVVPGIFLIFYVAIGFWTDEIIDANKPPVLPTPDCPKPCPAVCPTPPPVDICPPSIEDNCGGPGKDISGNITIIYEDDDKDISGNVVVVYGED